MEAEATPKVVGKVKVSVDNKVDLGDLQLQTRLLAASTVTMHKLFRSFEASLKLAGWLTEDVAWVDVKGNRASWASNTGH